MKVVAVAFLLVALLGKLSHGKETLLRGNTAEEWAPEVDETDETSAEERFERPDDWGLGGTEGRYGYYGSKGSKGYYGSYYDSKGESAVLKYS